LYACPEDLYPKEACDDAKVDMRKNNIKFVQQNPVRKHPMKEYRRVPLSLLRQRLKVEEYEKPAPFDNQSLKIDKVRMNLLQNIGKPSRPIVKVNQKVEAGEKIAQSEESELGVNLHSSIDGFITMITDNFIEIKSKRNTDG
ncbi:MAG: NADH dehydrogenase subunit, partial [Ignavibacteria bacterium]|nr:NADH dehydrogenase subunit [Ignavibacteria bacterium]